MTRPGTSGVAGVADARAGALSIAFLGDPNSVHLRRWVAEFSKRGHVISVLVPAGVEVDPGLPAGTRIAEFSPFTAHRPRVLGMLAARRSLRAALRRLAPDVLHAHYVTVNAWHAWLSGFHPYAITVWGSDVLITPREDWRNRLFARLSLRAADLVTGGSRYLVAAAIREGARPARTRYVHFGVDVDRFSPGPPPDGLRRRLGLDGCRILFSPRTIGPLYNQRTVVAALAQLPLDVVALMTLHLANEREVEAVLDDARRLGVADRIRIIDRVEHAEMPDYYRLADVVVSVPSSDGGPNTIVEALASGRPVVASNLPAVREWLDELDPGALVPVRDAAATAAAIRRALERPTADRASLAQRGRDLVEERADQRRTMAEMDELYCDLARRRRA